MRKEILGHSRKVEGRRLDRKNFYKVNNSIYDIRKKSCPACPSNLVKDYISGCVNFSFNRQSVSLLQAYLLLELPSSSLLAGTGGNRRRPAATGPLVFSVVRLRLKDFCNALK